MAYRDELQAAHDRIRTLEAQLGEKEAALAARGAEIAELEASLGRARRGGAPEPQATSGRVWAAIAVGVMLMGALFIHIGHSETHTVSSPTLADPVPEPMSHPVRRPVPHPVQSIESPARATPPVPPPAVPRTAASNRHPSSCGCAAGDPLCQQPCSELDPDDPWPSP